MTTLNGLPAHVLLVHVVVVLVPLVAVLLLVQAFWPAARRRLVALTAVLGVVALISVPLTTDAGEWLEHRIPRSPLIEAHTELGDDMLPWAIGLAVVALAYAGRELLSRRATIADTAAGAEHGGPGRVGPGAATAAEARPDRTTHAPGGVAVTVVLAVLAVVVAVGSVVTVYEIGDSGARAAWTAKYSPTQIWGRAQPDEN